MCIIDKVKGDAKKGLFFARKSLDNNWGRAVLLNFLSTDLYERQGAAPYDFTFLPGKERYQEAELKDALIEHITRFLVELGNGFSYVNCRHLGARDSGSFSVILRRSRRIYFTLTKCR
ncbi:MAG: DUF1016 family protein [Bacteroidales bacterium]|nr:DUF1016 family protein [Bacteroidales bacterium]